MTALPLALFFFRQGYGQEGFPPCPLALALSLSLSPFLPACGCGQPLLCAPGLMATASHQLGLCIAI